MLLIHLELIMRKLETRFVLCSFCRIDESSIRPKSFLYFESCCWETEAVKHTKIFRWQCIFCSVSHQGNVFH